MKTRGEDCEIVYGLKLYELGGASLVPLALKGRI